MESLNELFTEDQVSDMAHRVLKSVIDGIEEKITDKYYNEMSRYLYEHYLNASDKIKESLIADITEEFISTPSAYKFDRLRAKIFAEHREEICGILTDDVIKANMEHILLQYTNRDYVFSWRWKDEVVRLILANWDSFKDDDRIKDQFGRHIEGLEERVKRLTGQIETMRETLDEE